MAEEKSIAKSYSHALDQLTDCSAVTEKEKDFILYYLDSYNATQAYLKAFNTENKKEIGRASCRERV